jgi:hypothetical protein
VTTNAESVVTVPQTGFSGTVTVTRSDKAGLVGYAPAVPADWSNSSPVSVAEALDRIAAALGPIA